MVPVRQHKSESLSAEQGASSPTPIGYARAETPARDDRPESIPSLPRAIAKTMRPKQWAKNILVFTPLVTSHRILEVDRLLAGSIAFACFCVCASAVYVINDLVDIQYDRQHAQKRYRPVASGALTVAWSVPLAGFLLALGCVISVLTLPLAFSGALLAYVVTACGYSWFLKRAVMLDVLTLAGLYTVRVLAGGIATDIVVSEWLIAFCVFLFVSLAFVKRYAELQNLSRMGEVFASGRGYRTSDIGIVESMGTASGLIAVLVLALYVNAEQSKQLYAEPRALWLICPLLMYWVGRVWILAKRGELSEDPVVFALRDRVSLCLAVLIAVLLLMAAIR